MLIDCDTCTARGCLCNDCIIPMLLGAPTSGEIDGTCTTPLDEYEQRALRTLADSDMIPAAPFVAVYEQAPERVALSPV